jgi:hypothetical protein
MVTTVDGDECPVAMVMSPVLMPSLSVSNSLAFPCSGGAVPLIFKASPSQPTIRSREEPRTTFTLSWVTVQASRRRKASLFRVT